MGCSMEQRRKHSFSNASRLAFSSTPEEQQARQERRDAENAQRKAEPEAERERVAKRRQNVPSEKTVSTASADETGHTGSSSVT